MTAGPVPVEIRDEMIRLGQFLQVAGIVDGGSDAKALLAGGEVTVNGEPEVRRGRQLRPGDEVAVGGTLLVVALSA